MAWYLRGLTDVMSASPSRRSIRGSNMLDIQNYDDVACDGLLHQEDTSAS